MTEPGYLDGIQELYDGEIFGEGSASRMISLFPNVDRRKTAMLLQMEGEAKVRLRALLLRHGLSVEESEAKRAAGVRFAETRLRSLDWVETMRVIADLSQPALLRYRALLEAAPAEDREVVSFMVAHEEAFIRFAQLEAEGRSEAACAAISSILEHPL